ncbi:hypothetical protein [Sulfurimonas sediminis]|uniref:hypothetical protein n=1 Tax=Sulfurimonas sediminis TaxID=2590020 RepID=UPI001D04605F|nr:hypothetical protein [Sulfurimonas sediminis]
MFGEKLKIENEMEYEDLSGNKFLVTHGDFFDSITMTKKWLAVLGDYGYDLLLHLNCGDWVESCTAIVETLEGEWKIINFREK